jgi:hypothetical protein
MRDLLLLSFRTVEMRDGDAVAGDGVEGAVPASGRT